MLTKESISSETIGGGAVPQNEEHPPTVTSSSAIAMDTSYAQQQQQQKESTDNNNGSDTDDDDAVGAMIYNASRTAKLRAAAAAEEVPSSSNQQKETDNKKEKVKADSSTLKKHTSIKRARISVADRARMLINNTASTDDEEDDSRDISPGIPSQITAARKQVKQSQLPAIVHKDVPAAQTNIHEKEDVPLPPIVLNDGTKFQFNSAAVDEDMVLEIPKKEAEGVTFPYKLYNILQSTDDEQINQAIRWQPREGTAFRIYDNDMFVKHVLPKFSKATQLRSFHRQLYLWGFSRLIENSNIWYHPSFKRGCPEKLWDIKRSDPSYSKTAGPTAGMLEANYSFKEQQPKPTTTNIIKPNNEMIISNYDNYYNQYLTNMGLRDRILATLQYSAAMSSVRVTTTNDNKDGKKGNDQVEEVVGCSTAKQDAVPVDGVLKEEDVNESDDKDNKHEVMELEDNEESTSTPMDEEEEEEEETQQVIVRGGLISLPRSYVQERKDVCIPNAAWRKKQLIWDDVKKLLKEEEDGKQWPIRDEEPLRKPKSVQTADQLTREQVADQRIVQLNQLMRENVMLQKEAVLQKELLQREQEQDKKKKLSEQEIVDRRILKLALKNPRLMKDDPRLRRHVEVIALKYAQKQKALDGRQQQSTSLPTCEPKAKSPAVAVAAMAEAHSERIDRAILASAIKHPQAIKEDPLLRQQVEAIAFKYAQKQRALDGGDQGTLSKSIPTQHQSSQKIGRKAPSPRSITLSNSKASDRGQTIESTRPKKRVKMSEDCPIVHIDHSKGSQPTIFERRSCFRHGIEDLLSGKGSNGVHATSPEQWTKESRSLDSDDIITLYNVVGTTFPTKLYGMLLLAEHLGRQSNCISWVCNGYAFQIYDVDLFMRVIGQHFCKATRINSYWRQLRNWGFVRIPVVGEWAWYHEHFVRGQKSTISKIKTQRSEAEGSRETSSSPMEVQNQYPTTLSVSVSCGSPAPADAAVKKSIAGLDRLDQLAAAVEDEDDMMMEEDDTDRQPSSNDAQNGGVCIKHGAKKRRKICTHEGCTKLSQNGGVCAKHGAVLKTCKHDGCTNQRKQRGFCTRHYNLSIGRWTQCKRERRMQS